MREVCHTAPVVLGKCGSTNTHHFGPKKLGSVAGSLLGFLNASAVSTGADGDRRLAAGLLGRVVPDGPVADLLCKRAGRNVKCSSAMETEPAPAQLSGTEGRAIGISESPVKGTLIFY